MSAAEICSLVTYYVIDFEKLKKKEGEKRPKKKQKWEPPQPDCYKINIDAFYRATTWSDGWGFVARNSNGEFLEGACGHLERLITIPIHAEALAALKSLQRVAQLEMTKIIVETDATNLEKALRSDSMDRSPEGCIFHRIREFMSGSSVQCEVRSCRRSCNKMADSLAAYGASVVRYGSDVFMDQSPEFVTNLVSGDMPRAIGQWKPLSQFKKKRA